MEASMDLFINLIQNHRIVYDKCLKDFKNTKKKEEAWQDIAKQSRMTVDAVKKRYTSMRQKYCREKRNIELNRRNKRSTHCNWIYFDRLHFLDSFIQPRSTYTNDTFSEGEDDTVNSHNTSPNIEIDVEDGIDIDESDIINSHDQNIEGLVDESNEDSPGIADGEPFNLRVGERIVSDYSGEKSVLFYFASPNACVPDDESNRSITNNAKEVQSSKENANEVPSSNEQSSSAQSVDMNNYMSPFPSTSRVSSSISSAVKASIVSKRESLKNHKPAYKPVSRQNSHPQQQTSLRIDSSDSTRTTSQLFHTGTLNVPATSSSELSSKDKRIEAIRQKMDSCLTAINNKVSDKAQRSPHAAFLAYLGAKLPNVPEEKLPQLEREVLELVHFHSV